MYATDIPCCTIAPHPPSSFIFVVFSLTIAHATTSWRVPATGNETGAPVPCDSRIQIFMAGVPRGVASRLAPIQPVGGKKKKKKKNGGERKGEGKGRLRYRCPLIFLSFHPRKSFTEIIKGCHFAVIYILYITPSIVHEARSCSIRKAFNFGRTVSNNRPPGRESRGTWIFWWMENSQVGRNASLLFVHCLYSYDTGSIIYIFLYFIFGIVFEPVI